MPGAAKDVIRMDPMAVFVVILNFCLIGALPLVFFRRRDGGLNGRWWFTALPLFLAPIFVGVVAITGMTPPFTLAFEIGPAPASRIVQDAREALATLTSAVSVGLICFT